MVYIIIALIIIIVLFTFNIAYRRDIKYISKQIKLSKGEFTNIRMKTINKDIENLVININELYELNRKINTKIINNDEELRKSIANISHDLRTPLTSIMGYMQLIKDDSLIQEEKTKYIKIIEARTYTLQNLINSFYNLARIEANEYKFNLKSINLKNILCDIIALFYNEFLENNLEPNITIEENIQNIISDEDAVTRIFTNLIGNMTKHTNVIQHTNNKFQNDISITLKNEGEFIVTEFKNSAPNLKTSDIEHIFERFYTADSTRSDKNTGLGLSIVKTLTQKLGHKVEAILKEGELNIKITWNTQNNKNNMTH
jgi:signal transduction histidine kinase